MRRVVVEVDVDDDGGRGRGEGERGMDAEDGEREEVRTRDDVDDVEAEEVERRMGRVGIGLIRGGRGGGSTICGIGGRGTVDVDVEVEDFVAASERRLDNLLKLNADPDFLPILAAFRSS